MAKRKERGIHIASLQAAGIVFILFVVLLVGSPLLILLVPPQIHRLFVVVLLTIVYLLVAFFAWQGFRRACKKAILMESGEPLAAQKAWMTVFDPLHFLWFWMLTIGLWAIFVGHCIQQVKPGKVVSFQTFIREFIENNSTALFAIILSALLVDFIIVLFLGMRKASNKMETSRHAVEQASKNMEQAAKLLRESKDNTASSTSALAQARGELQKAVALLTGFQEEAEFLTPRLKAKDFAGKWYEDSGRKLPMKMVQALSAYPIGKDVQSVEKRIAVTFIESYLDVFVSSRRHNIVQANFGMMARIVDQLYAIRDELRRAYAKECGRDDVELVYFTTLTMPPNRYLAPDTWDGIAPSMIRAWDEYRQHTRKWTYWKPVDPEKPEQGCSVREGHMLDFLLKSEKYSFRRCCLWLKGASEAQTSEAGIKYSADWNAHFRKVSDRELPITKAYYGPVPANIPDSEFPKYLDKFKEGPPYSSIPRVSGGTELSSQSDEASPLNVFIKLYHPFTKDCRGMGLSPKVIKKLLKSEEYGPPLEKLFRTNDETWQRLMAGSEGSSGNTANLWYDVFFNQQIPLDIFAIGVRHRDSEKVEDAVEGTIGKVEWKGCLSGFIGGDLYSMELGWDDEFISRSSKSSEEQAGAKAKTAAPEQASRWQAIVAFIDFLYYKSQRVWTALGNET